MVLTHPQFGNSRFEEDEPVLCTDKAINFCQAVLSCCGYRMPGSRLAMLQNDNRLIGKDVGCCIQLSVTHHSFYFVADSLQEGSTKHGLGIGKHKVVVDPRTAGGLHWLE